MNLPRFDRSILTLVSGAVLATFTPDIDAQNLLTPAGWMVGPENPSFIKSFSSTARILHFNPQSHPSGQWCCISQEVSVPTAGNYQIHFSGYGGGTGSFDYEIVVGGQSLRQSFQEGMMVFADTIRLTAGKHLVKFRSSTTSLGFSVDVWRLNQPTLTGAVLPSIRVEGESGNFNNDARLVVTTNANFLALSLSRIAPIQIPGFTHGLELAPATCEMVAVSGSGRISLAYDQQLWGLPHSVWPTAFVQAATFSAFGSAVLIDK